MCHILKPNLSTRSALSLKVSCHNVIMQDSPECVIAQAYANKNLCYLTRIEVNLIQILKKAVFLSADTGLYHLSGKVCVGVI